MLVGMGQQHGIPTLTPDVRTKLSQSRLSSLASLVSLRSYGQDQAQSPGRKVAALGLSITSGEIAAGDARSSVCASSRHSMAMPCVNGVVASCLPPLTQDRPLFCMLLLGHRNQPAEVCSGHCFHVAPAQCAYPVPFSSSSMFWAAETQ